MKALCPRNSRNRNSLQGNRIFSILTDDALFDRVQKDIVEPRDAYLKAVDKTGFEAMLTKGRYKI